MTICGLTFRKWTCNVLHSSQMKKKKVSTSPCLGWRIFPHLLGKHVTFKAEPSPYVEKSQAAFYINSIHSDSIRRKWWIPLRIHLIFALCRVSRPTRRPWPNVITGAWFEALLKIFFLWNYCWILPEDVLILEAEKGKARDARPTLKSVLNYPLRAAVTIAVDLTQSKWNIVGGGKRTSLRMFFFCIIFI